MSPLVFILILVDTYSSQLIRNWLVHKLLWCRPSSIQKLLFYFRISNGWLIFIPDSQLLGSRRRQSLATRPNVIYQPIKRLFGMATLPARRWRKWNQTLLSSPLFLLYLYNLENAIKVDQGIPRILSVRGSYYLFAFARTAPWIWLPSDSSVFQLSNFTAYNYFSNWFCISRIFHYLPDLLLPSLNKVFLHLFGDGVHIQDGGMHLHSSRADNSLKS